MNRDQQGAVTVFVTIMTVALLAVAGLVVDGGRILAARREASNVAESAARAGSQALDVTVLRAQNRVVLDPARAQNRASDYLTGVGYMGDVTADTERVHVTVTIHRPTLLLGPVGVGDFTVIGAGDATPVRGIRNPGAP